MRTYTKSFYSTNEFAQWLQRNSHNQFIIKSLDHTADGMTTYIVVSYISFSEFM